MTTVLSADALGERARDIITDYNDSRAAAARDCGRVGCVRIAGMTLADICAVVCAAGDFWPYCLRAVWGRDRAFRARLRREIAELPVGTAGLDHVVYCIPHLVFYARPQVWLPGPAAIGRLTVPYKYIWE